MRTVLGALHRSLPRSTGGIFSAVHGTARRSSGPVLRRSKDLWTFIRGAHRHAADPAITKVFAGLRDEGRRGPAGELSRDEQRAAYHLAYGGTMKGEELERVTKGIIEYSRDHGGNLARGLGTGSVSEAAHRYLRRIGAPAPSELPDRAAHPDATTSISRTRWTHAEEGQAAAGNTPSLGSMSAGALRYGSHHAVAVPSAPQHAVDPFGSVDE